MTNPEPLSLNNKFQMQHPTGELRWYGGALQQEWVVTQFENAIACGSAHEWRDVPTVQDENK